VKQRSTPKRFCKNTTTLRRELSIGANPECFAEAIRSAVKYLNENASDGPVKLHVHLTSDRIIGAHNWRRRRSKSFR
jgi:hypothetical protein